MKYQIFPLSDNSLTIDFGSKVSSELNSRILQMTDFFDRRRLAGFIESVPAYSSLTVFYDILKVRKAFPQFATAFEAVENLMKNAVADSDDKREIISRTIEIPVCFDPEFAPDLEFVAERNNLSTKEAIEIFINRTYRVFMLGFLPGFAYMGEVDKRIAAPRRQNPRLLIPQNSVGIAGRQTGIYPLESPGGWQIIGKTSLQLFTPQSENPTFLRVGDSVKFYEATREIFGER